LKNQGTFLLAFTL